MKLILQSQPIELQKKKTQQNYGYNCPREIQNKIVGRKKRGSMDYRRMYALYRF